MATNHNLGVKADMRYTLTLSAYQWLLIHGTLDNEVYMETLNYDPRNVVEVGKSVIRGIEDNAYGVDRLPLPHDQVVEIGFSGRQWVMVADALTQWATVADESMPAVSVLGSEQEDHGYVEPVEDGTELWELLRVLRTQLPTD